MRTNPVQYPRGMDAVALHSGEYVERFKSQPIERVRNLVRRMDIKPTDRIADFGCGTGLLLQALDEFGTYDGVDFSPDFIRVAKDWGKGRGRFHCADIISFSEEHRGQFDIAATLDFSEHIDDATFEAIYSAIRSSLKPEGRLYLHTPNLDFFMERLKDRGILKQFPEHIAVRTAEHNVDLLKRCGFKSVTCEVIPHYNALKLVHPLSKLPLLGKGFGARLWITAS